MFVSEERRKLLEKELQYSASRSSGPGGQNVNKVSSKVELRFSIQDSSVLSLEEKQLITGKLQNKINSENELILVSSTERSQWRNKVLVTQKFFKLFEMALTPARKRIATKPTKISRIKRLDGKKLQALKKELRRKPKF